MAYALNCTVFAILLRMFVMRFTRWRTGRMQYAPTNAQNQINGFPPNTPKITSDVEKTMSYVEKIMSDII